MQGIDGQVGEIEAGIRQRQRPPGTSTARSGSTDH
jgi:hypothetical protein